VQYEVAEAAARIDQIIQAIQAPESNPFEGAAASTLPDPMPETVKQDRPQRFTEIQAEISRDKLALRV
jgi:tRNA A37 methylthiotransferase MiaB